MAKIIVKAPYYKPGHKTPAGKTRGGYLDYIAKREGVEILRSGMLDYIGERHGSNGLFSDEGVKINLAAVRRELDSHPGNVWGYIISLKREDAERLGYNSAAAWINLLRSNRNFIAKEMGISPGNLRWYAAYHNKEANPHVHMMVWSAKPQEPYLTPVGIHNIRKKLAGDIFQQEHISIYKKQTSARDHIKSEYRARIATITDNIRKGKITYSPELMTNLALLSEKLKEHKGKPVYGYLSKENKALAKTIVRMLGAEPQLRELYDLWHKYKCEISHTYTDATPPQVPIEENEEFRSLRNLVVSFATNIGKTPDHPSEGFHLDYEELYDKRNDRDYLRNHCSLANPMVCYRLGRYYLNQPYFKDEAEYYLREAADQGLGIASYLIYKAYRDKVFDDYPGDQMRYLRMAADTGLGYAEYTYAKHLKKKAPDKAREYLARAAEHECYQAEYDMGNLYLAENKLAEARKWFERAARHGSAWTKTRVGLLLCYQYEDYEAGEEFLNEAANTGYAPAKEALSGMEQNRSMQLLLGVCDLFYDISVMFSTNCESLFGQDEHRVNFHKQERSRGEKAKRRRLGQRDGEEEQGMYW